MARPRGHAFRLLGPVQAGSSGAPVRFRRAQHRDLLALLLLHVNRSVTVGELVEGLWGGATPATVTAQVQNAVSALRTALAAAHVPAALVREGGGYVLRTDPALIDLTAFTALTSSARPARADADPDPDAACDRLRTGLALWRGEPLGNVRAPFAGPARLGLAERRAAAVEALFAAELDRGRHAEIVAELIREVEAHPLREQLRGQLMTALVRSGRRAEALQTYRAGARRLADEHGLRPGPALRALELAILRSDGGAGTGPADHAPRRDTAPAPIATRPLTTPPLTTPPHAAPPPTAPSHAAPSHAAANAAAAPDPARPDEPAEKVRRHRWGRPREAIADHEQALVLDRRSGWQQSQAVNLCNLGFLHGELGELADAASRSAEALALHRQIGSPSGEATVVIDLATLHGRLGAPVDAHRATEEAVAISRRAPAGVGGRLADRSPASAPAASSRVSGDSRSPRVSDPNAWVVRPHRDRSSSERGASGTGRRAGVRPPPALPPLMPFDEACRLVLEHLDRQVPLAFWSISRYEGDQQVHLSVHDQAYGTVAGDSRPWSESLCQHMVAGRAPRIAPDAMAVPEYARAALAHTPTIGAYLGVPIRSADGTLFGTLWGLDPRPQPPAIARHEPLLHLFAGLLGQILHADRLRAEAVEREAELRWSAFHDPLTGLPNRAMFLDRVAHALALHTRNHRPVAVLLADLDDFKAVNDTLGHATGDDLLKLAARRLARAVRPGDTVARLSGDEFAILLEDATEPTTVADRIVTALAEPFSLGDTSIKVSASVGVTGLGAEPAPHPGTRPASTHTGDAPHTGDGPEPTAAGNTSVDAVLAHADIAMYTAKRAGKGRFTVYDPLMTLPGTRTLRLREPLRRAIAGGAIAAAYQPVVELSTGRPIGYEALARWPHDDTTIGPDIFIPIAASSGLMPALTDHMLDLAGAQIARWSAQLGHRRLRVSVNVSPYCISDPSLPHRVAACIHRHDIGPRQLALEITEDALLHDLPIATTVARELRDLDVVLSLDDFGAGYSSLLHLHQIPLHSVKIDRGFAGDLDTNPDTRRFMRALLTLGRDLGLRVIVEGVERRAQADVLHDIGGTYAQGHLFGVPAPPPDLHGAEQGEPG